MAPQSDSALGADSILDYMNKSLSSSPPAATPASGEGPSPLLKDPYAAIALFCHACMLAVGFRLIGLGEDHKLEAHSEPEQVRPLPSEWAASSTYAFRYAHSQSSMEYLLKVSRLGSKALIFGVGLGDDKTASFEVKAADYTSEGSLKEATADDADKKTALRNIMISSGRVADLVSLFKTSIIQKLAPGISKAGYEDSSSTTSATATATATAAPDRNDRRPPPPPDHDPLRDDRLPPPARPYPFDDPLAAAPRRPHPPGDFPPPDFEDEYELNRPPRGMPGGPGHEPFGRLGERDLYPPGLGPHDPLRIGPGGGGGLRGGGGMHPTFDDPLFGGGGGYGGGGYDPRAPPGARYDPLGPGDGPPNLRGGPRFPGGGMGGGGNPFGGFGRGDFI